MIPLTNKDRESYDSQKICHISGGKPQERTLMINNIGRL